MINCPYCDRPARLADSSEVYNGRSYGMIWLCEPCGAWVGCHEGTTVPLGTLANSELRNWRKEAHAAFDPLWKERGLTRREAYRWLAMKLGVPVEECHIGRFRVGMCQLTVQFCRGVGEAL